MLEGVFVKGDLEVTIEGQINLSFKQCFLSLFGATGLPWGNLKPSEVFGSYALTEIQLINSTENLKIKTTSQILKESTAHSSNMVLKFALGPSELALLTNYIQKHGAQ